MSSRVTNAALKDSRDEAAILLSFWGNTRQNGGERTPQLSTQLERWRKMTEWVAQVGESRILGEESGHIGALSNSCLRESLEDIARLTSLDEDWNDEGAPAIDRAAILRTQKSVQWLASVTVGQPLTEDCIPAIFPSIDGGVKLHWKRDGSQVALSFRPGRNTIEVMQKKFGAAATVRAVSETEASVIALEAAKGCL